MKYLLPLMLLLTSCASGDRSNTSLTEFEQTLKVHHDFQQLVEDDIASLKSLPQNAVYLQVYGDGIKSMGLWKKECNLNYNGIGAAKSKSTVCLRKLSDIFYARLSLEYKYADAKRVELECKASPSICSSHEQFEALAWKNNIENRTIFLQQQLEESRHATHNKLREIEERREADRSAAAAAWGAAIQNFGQGMQKAYEPQPTQRLKTTTCNSNYGGGFTCQEY